MNSPEIPHLPDESDPDQPRYAVSALSANGESFVDATKTWGEDHFERIVIPQPDWPNAYAIAQEADSALWRGDLQTAMNLIEISAVEAGVIDPLREDPRLFTQGPPDPFTTIREADLGFQARESLEGRTEDMENLYGQLDRARIEGSHERPLDTAQHEAELRERIVPGSPSFGVIPNSADLPDGLPFTFGEGMQPYDAQGIGQAHHVDGGGTAHWFSVVENDEPEAEPYELRYFRVLETRDGTLKHDSYPVMLLPDADPGSAWPLPGLEMYLAKGDVYMAQQFAHDVADNNGIDFPAPMALPALDPEPDYYFGYGVSPNNQPSIEAVKTWMDGAERRFDTFTIAEYGMYEEAQVDEQELDDLMHDEGLEAAMNKAERMAVAGGHLDPQREDGRVFLEDDAPPDPFTTERTRAMQREMQHDPEYSITAISADGSSHLDVTKAWGEDQHAHLLIPQPDWDTAATNAQAVYDLMLNDDLQTAMNLVEISAVEAGVIDPLREDPRLFTQGPPDPFTTIREADLGFQARESLEGAAWFEAHVSDSQAVLLEPLDPAVNYAVAVHTVDPQTIELTVDKYWKAPNGYLGIDSQTIQTFDSEDDTQRKAAEAAREGLLEVYDERGLEAMMHLAELNAMRNGHLNGGRRDERLFRDGPPDRFETLAQQLADEPNPYWNVGDDRVEEAPAPGSWDEIIAQQPDEEPEQEHPYWQMHYRPVETPEGKSLGTALFVTEFPQLPPDFDDYVKEYGMDDTVYPTEARTLEMAHFANEEEARKFEKEFRSYLVPDLLDGPELAPEVAKLEGLSGEWQDMDYQGIVDYMSGSRTIVREESDWHPHNPHAERDARIEAEGVYYDPIQLDSRTDPDFDL